MDEHQYLIALGSNRRARGGVTPAAMISAAMAALVAGGCRVVAMGPTVHSAPIGPAQRRFANSAAWIATALAPPALLALAKSVERRLGRRSGQRWGNRSIDIDLILWSGGRWRERRLILPHPRWRERSFVLEPLSAVGGDWRDPESGRRVHHWHAIRNRGR